ncbi:MAG: alpha/beta hydrolase [Planctomycetota bacterium]
MKRPNAWFPAGWVLGLLILPAWIASETVGADWVYEDVAYGEHERHRLDLYPVPGASQPTPAVVYFHGGGFVRGDKDRVSRKMIRRLHERGIAVASANYRFANQAFLPAPMHDGARAVQYLRHHSERFGLDPDTVAVSGTSAGAGIALWVALRDDRRQPESDDPVLRQSSRVSAAWVFDAQVSYDPAFWEEQGLDGVVTDDKLRDLFGDVEGFAKLLLMSLIQEASPITHVSDGDPPLRMDYRGSMALDRRTSAAALLHHPLHGTALAEACREVGVPCELYYDGGVKPQDSAVDFLAGHLKNDQTRGQHDHDP